MDHGELISPEVESYLNIGYLFFRISYRGLKQDIKGTEGLPLVWVGKVPVGIDLELA
jgi:hypothetical protein